MSKIPKNTKNPFRLPENYFDTLSDELQCRIAEEKLKSKFGNKNPFTIPENYFENSDKHSFNKKHNFTYRKNQFSILLKTSISIAAGVVLFIGLRTLFFENNTSKTNFTNVSNFGDSSNNLALDNEIYEDIDENTIVSFISETKDTVSDTTQISDDELIEYVADNTTYSDLLADL